MGALIDEKIDQSKNKVDLAKAKRYQKYLSYLVENQFDFESAGDALSSEALKSIWKLNNPFMNWLRDTMRKDNFERIIKQARPPFKSASLIKYRVIPEWKKVFLSQNANFDYTFENDKKMEAMSILESKGYGTEYYESMIMDLLLSRHNNIIITDLPNEESTDIDPYRNEIHINNVEMINFTDHTSTKIKEIIWCEDAVKENGDPYTKKYWYTDEFYSVWSDEEKQGEFSEIFKKPHDIGECPATMPAVKRFNSDTSAWRESLFSSVSHDLELFVFYSICLSLTMPNGAFPTISYYKHTNQPCGTQFDDHSQCNKGYLGKFVMEGEERVFRTQKDRPCPVCNKENVINQVGTVVEVPIPLPPDGVDPSEWRFNMDLNANFMKFHYIPTEVMEFLTKYTKDLGEEIFMSLTGKDTPTRNNAAKNVDQVQQSNDGVRNRLTDLSKMFSKVRSELDRIFFKLIYGKNYISNSINFGDSFLIETEEELMKMKQIADNPISKIELEQRIITVKYRANDKMKAKNLLLLDLLPYNAVADSVFFTMEVNPVQKELRLNFPKYIKQFETTYGDVLEFVTTAADEQEAFKIVRIILEKFVILYEPPKEEKEEKQEN